MRTGRRGNRRTAKDTKYSLYEEEDRENRGFYFHKITDLNAMVCSVEFANEIKALYRKEVPEPGDNLDMILRYCGPWSEAFWKEEHRKTFELTYRVCLENGEISVKPSYPLTVLYAHDPVDFTYTPLYEGFETAVPLLVTRGCFPGRQQNHEPQYRMWELVFITEEILQWSRELSEKPDYVDFYYTHEWVDALEEGFIDNRPPYCYGPSCPDRMLSYHTNRHILLQMLKDFDAISRSMGICCENHGMFVATLVATWYNEINRRKAVMTAQNVRIPFLELVSKMERVRLWTIPGETQDERIAWDRAYRKNVSEAFDTVMREIDHMVRVDIPPYSNFLAGELKKEKRRILANRRRALRDFETPQDVYGDGTGTNVVKIYIDSDYEEEEDWEEEEDLASKILKN